MTRTLAEPTPLGLLEAGQATLEAAGLADARQSAEWLLGAVIGGGRFGAYLDPARALSDDQARRYRGLVERRAGREPLQHLLGAEEFSGIRLAVTPDVLIPRPETEGLVEWAADVLGAHSTALVADVGTGSGAIACALARRLSRISVVAVDCSVAALAMARQNVEALGLLRRVGLVAGDLLEPLRRRDLALDLIVANLPYLPSELIDLLPAEVSAWEPRVALDGGRDGMSVLRRLIAEAAAALAPGGWLLIEVGEGQSVPIASRMRFAGFAHVECRRDLNGIERYVGGRRALDPEARASERARARLCGPAGESGPPERARAGGPR